MANNNTQIDPSFTILKSNRLKVEIAAPGIPLPVFRFDLNGFVTQVTLDGTHTFCVPESYIPGFGCQGAGLCNELNHLVLDGFDEEIGEIFPKLGIGLLKRQRDESLDERGVCGTELHPDRQFPSLRRGDFQRPMDHHVRLHGKREPLSTYDFGGKRVGFRLWRAGRHKHRHPHRI